MGPWEWDGREGPVPTLEVAPGLIRLTAPDLNRREKSANRAADRPAMVSDGSVSEEAAALLEGIGGMDAEECPGGTRGVVRGWSRKSRARMVAALAEVDLAPLLMAGDDPAMVTLTYPGRWEEVAPDGETVKRHLGQFWKRYERAWGPVCAVWKLEFQRRGAPHFHILMAPPGGVAGAVRRRVHEEAVRRWELEGGRRPRWREAVGDDMPFRQWLSMVWADIVAHPDPVERMRHESAGTAVDYTEGDRARDPKRAAVYFGKHGSFAAKDYQHNVPELWLESGKSVGRFWGYKGLSKVRGAATLEFDTMLFLGRVLRRYGTRTRVWGPVAKAHVFRPVLRTVYRPRRRVRPDGTVVAALDGEGAVILDGEGMPVDRVHYRKQTVRARRMSGPMGAGFLLVNDGPDMARVLARAVAAARGAGGLPPVGMRGPVAGRV